MKSQFKENQIYYNNENKWKLRYKEQTLDGYFHFAVVEHDDKEYDWAEYSTKDGSEIVKTKGEL